ncbi:FMN-dependent NADH-azoreductase [Bacillus sonorensis]|uniref:FMN dependent NADH:quinone oxidoreductase n=2 Tax=Bacillus sonorensis TaxID=119858 RepID=M5PHU7_9BACI|nr:MULTISPECIES: FMN-dependent NADH-azoreductase [Bacillus]TWK82386.1 FMN-dependent NADH-azoreductase 1 [Bacillus paralicheniformis]ASB88873.1 FMN-dependent NADH-azoreductase [Bacillus sonorensis]EME76322.1 azoreductase [Bacillus sonorensis L12]MBG9915340.1 FMN-dependent NADH-azoreductase [Bacillus sonorensis]MCF7618224.1 FMN-dependent NADH-azoreductase [Bacillus sonorensis]
MSKVLFVKANDRTVEEAVSVKLYEAFLNSYKENHPNDEIIELDLYKENPPYLGRNAINGTFKAGKGMELTEEEKAAAAVADRYLDQFVKADKVVFAFPLWNFAVPAVLHTYIDYLSRAGVTFTYTPEGPKGLMGDKKVALLNARGGIYSEGPMAAMEMSLNYMKTVMGFFGIQDLHTVVVEGHNALPDQAQKIIEDGLAEAKKAAAAF